MRTFPPWTWEIPEFFNIAVACTDAHLATAVAERVAVIIDDDALGTRQLTYAELADRTDRFAQVLREIGTRPGERVLIRLPNCIEYPVVFLGAMKCGAVPVPTSIILTTDEVCHLATDSGASILVTDGHTWDAMGDRVEALPAIQQVVLTHPSSAPRGRRLIPIELAPALDHARNLAGPHLTRADDPAYLVYTSGSTSYPKGVLHAHRSLLGRQPASRYWFDLLPAGDRVLHSGKFNWTYVLGTGLMDPLYGGHTAILHEGSADGGIWPPLIAKYRATTFIGVPTLYRHIIQHTQFTGADVPSLRHCMCAGEPLSGEVLAAWKERFGLDIYEGLGMTECSYYICQTPSRPIRPGSAGFMQPGHDMKLLDPETWREVDADEEGLICIPRRDPALMLRYWNQVEETERCFRGDWYLTGDYARRDADGYIWFLGRKDDLINTFGYRVSPHEVERVIKDHPAIADAAAVGEEITPTKVIVAVYVIPKVGTGLTPDDVIHYAREHLASYKAPRIAYFVAELPRTRNGKILRRALDPSRARARSEPD